MPYHPSKYVGFDYFWRSSLAAMLCTVFTTFMLYPLDLIHTRISADMTPQNNSRLFKTTFDCFNRTNLDEGRLGLYKGIDIALIQTMLRACLTMPIYDYATRSRSNQSSST